MFANFTCQVELLGHSIVHLFSMCDVHFWCVIQVSAGRCLYVLLNIYLISSLTRWRWRGTMRRRRCNCCSIWPSSSCRTGSGTSLTTRELFITNPSSFEALVAVEPWWQAEMWNPTQDLLVLQGNIFWRLIIEYYWKLFVRSEEEGSDNLVNLHTLLSSVDDMDMIQLKYHLSRFLLSGVQDDGREQISLQLKKSLL